MKEQIAISLANAIVNAAFEGYDALARERHLKTLDAATAEEAKNQALADVKDRYTAISQKTKEEIAARKADLAAQEASGGSSA